MESWTSPGVMLNLPGLACERELLGVALTASRIPFQDKPRPQTGVELSLPSVGKDLENFGQEKDSESSTTAALAPIQMFLLSEHQQPAQPCSTPAAQADPELSEEDITIYPRSARLGGCDGPKSPVRITREILTECFSMPLHAAADHMGICITALKKVCRKFGIQKWPYRESMLNGARPDGDTAAHHHEVKAKAPRSALASLADAACSSADSEERSSSYDDADACEGKSSIAALLMASETILGQSVLG